MAGLTRWMKPLKPLVLFLPLALDNDVEIFLGGNGWTQLEGTNRKGKQWFVRAFSPKDSSQSSHWRYDVESGEIPNSWWKETPSVVIDLSGGVNTRASSNGTPSLHSFSPVGSCRKAKSLAAVPPRKKQVPGHSCRGSSSAGTPSIHTAIDLTHAYQKNKCGKPQTPSCGRFALLSNICASSQSARTNNARTLVATSEAQPRKQVARVWTCPYCSMRIESDKPGKKLSTKRRNI